MKPHDDAVTSASDAIRPYDVAAVGETMATLVTQPPGPLNAGTRMLLDAGGAESNVAICLAQAGRRVAWVSRVGGDSLGRMIKDRVGGAGVDVSLVTTDPGAPTGLYLREPGRVWYYRARSAASRLTPAIWAAEALRGARIVYLTGITPALSASCHELVEGALSARPLPDALYVFDINHRPSLWRRGRAARVLADLARRADIVFVGRDEAAALWGGSGDGAAWLTYSFCAMVTTSRSRSVTSLLATLPRAVNRLVSWSAPPRPQVTRSPFWTCPQERRCVSTAR